MKLLEDLIIRKSEESDFSQCQNLWIELTRYHQEIYDDSSIGGENLAQGYLNHLEEYGNESIWVAESNNKIIGLIGLIIKGKEAEVEPVIVSLPFRKKGVGKKLLQFIINYATKEGINYLTIRPVARNKKAISIFH
ncbi:MAG: GNAT family N-acetyltransferase, partial [Candidatus Heimdallarchaeaceae archaeon]